MEKSYFDPTLPPEDRARLLMAEMTVGEKLSQLRCIFPFMAGYDDKEFLAAQVAEGIGQVSTLQMRDMATVEEAAAWQRMVQELVMEKSPHHIPAVFHMEGLCGPFLQDSTSFPSGIGRGSTWNPKLEEKIGEVVSRQEAACGITQTLAPVLDVTHDARMGRTGESYGEDPTLVGVMGSAYARGLHKNTTAGRRTEGMAKHFLAFHNSQGGIHGTHSDTTPRTLREIYGKPFQMAINEGGLRAVMPCYCSIDGEPVSASKKLLTGLLREEMGFHGVCGSDYGGISNAHTVHHIGETLEEAGLLCMEAGMDLELPSTVAYNDKLQQLFESGEADMAVLDRAVFRVLTAKFRMGIFENPFAYQGEELRAALSQKADEELTLQAARESMILLKNNGALPLKKDIRKLAVIGPHAGFANKLFGGYTHLCMAESTYAVASSLAGIDPEELEKRFQNVETASERAGVMKKKRPGELNYLEKMRQTLQNAAFVPGTAVQSDETPLVQAVLKRQKPNCPSLLEELRRLLPEVEIAYAYGYPVAGADQSCYEEALAVARGADAVLLTLGGKHGTCSLATTGEGVDASNINLPECQEVFIRLAAELGKPLIGIHFDGRPISSNAADQYLDAILEAWSPAEMGARAVGEVLLGRYNPGGKLPVSVAYHAGQIPVYYNHPYGSSWHQGDSIGFQDYMDLPHTPRYPFGFGLSYTKFQYSQLQLSTPAIAPDGSLDISFCVENVGDRTGDEVVQLYIRDEYASLVRPVLELAGFRRVTLQPGEKKKITFTLFASQTAFLDRDMRWKIEKGRFQFSVGGSSQEPALSGSFVITENAWPNGPDRAMYANSLEVAL